jgi:hypothetical protein
MDPSTLWSFFHKKPMLDVDEYSAKMLCSRHYSAEFSSMLTQQLQTSTTPSTHPLAT